MAEVHLKSSITAVDSFVAPYAGWYRIQVNVSNDDPIDHSVTSGANKQKRVWTSRAHAIAAGLAVYEMNRMSAGGTWDFAGAGSSRSALLEVELYLDARDKYEVSDSISTVGYVGPAEKTVPRDCWLSV